MIFKIGCSGFLNRHWKGVFYPEQLAQSKWFTFYCEHFNTLELNVTFYKFPTVKMLENWYNKSSLGFTFIVKTPRIITHYKKLQDCSELIEEFYKVCNVGLKEKLGGLLFQFPPSFHYSEETLELIIKSLHPSFNNIVEFRNSSWWNEVVFKSFKENNITFCSINHPKLPEEIIATSASIYVRLHGNPNIFYSSYSDNFLFNLHEEITQRNSINKAFVLFNNTASTAGILNAQQIKLYI